MATTPPDSIVEPSPSSTDAPQSGEAHTAPADAPLRASPALAALVSPPEPLPLDLLLASGVFDGLGVGDVVGGVTGDVVGAGVVTTKTTVAANSAACVASRSTFTAANGEPIVNQGQMVLNLASREGNPLQSTFQVCAVSRPLWSVGRICDNGCTVTFDAKGASVKSKDGKEVCTFERRNGLYASTLGLRKPGAEIVLTVKSSGFTRQGR